MPQRKVKVGTKKEVSGEVNVASGDINIRNGSTANQVYALVEQSGPLFNPSPLLDAASPKDQMSSKKKTCPVLRAQSLVDDLVKL